MKSHSPATVPLVLLTLFCLLTPSPAGAADLHVTSTPQAIEAASTRDGWSQAEHGLPDPAALPRRGGHTRAGVYADGQRFADLDLTAEARAHAAELAGGEAGKRASAALPADLDGLCDLLRGRELGAAFQDVPLGSEPAGPGRATRGEPSGERALPWAVPYKLADATRMNDQYVSLQRAPSGTLFAVWQAYDLGSSDRDIHIARSLNDGESWTVYDLPSFDQDEYHPELAIDAAGYLYIVWIRADGVVLRTRSSAPESPTSWAWIKGLITEETHATPCIAVSGSGAYSRVFICSAWLTINWNLMQYEWTLIWLFSSNGGETAGYDYFDPDGYPDYWPDAEMNGNQVYLINAEQDYYTGEFDVLAAEGSLGGAFGEPWYLSSWTNFDCQFPTLAAEGDLVYCAFQMVYDDGMGDSNGDIVFCYSDDGLASVYGPYEMAVDDWDSVGPVLYSRDGVVGCLWLDAAPGDDEFILSARQAGSQGHPDAWGDIETVRDQRYVDPSYRGCAGAVGDGMLHAAWIDKRDFPTEGLNVYGNKRSVLPNLAPATPLGWDDALVVGVNPGERHNTLLPADETVYLSFAFSSDGMSDITQDIGLRLLVDGVPAGVWSLPGGLASGYYSTVEDHELMLGVGAHTIQFELDFSELIVEEDESDNLFGGSFQFIDGDPLLALDTNQIVHVFEERCAASPQVPLIERLTLPVLSPDLADALASAGPADRLRVVVEPCLRVDCATLTARLSGWSRAERNAYLGKALRDRSAANLAALSPLIDALVAAGEAAEPRELWLAGSLLCELSPAALRELAASPHVGRLWLDDTHSGFFSRPSDTQAPPVITQSAADSRLAGAGDPEAARDRVAAADRSATRDRALAWHLNHVGAPAAWAQGYDGEGVLIGHLDSGVAWDHPDLLAGLWDGGASVPHHGWDYLDEDDDPYDGDTQYHHGTHTAGCIIGDGSLGTTTGIAPGARLMSLRCVPGYFEDFVQGLQFCLDHGAQVINASAGWSDPPPELKDANRYNAEVLAAAGIVWICAAGNGDNYGGHNAPPQDIATPGDCPHPFYGDGGHSAVIAVGASTNADQLNALSSIGPTAWDTDAYTDYPYPPGLMKPDLVAPGQSISSTVPGGYAAYDGSSMATPLVSAAAAILLQASPGLPLSELAETLENSVVDILTPGRDMESGAGRLDIAAALAQLPGGAWESLTIRNEGELPLFVEDFVHDAPWLTFSPGQATIQPGEQLNFALLFDPTSLSEGIHTADVEIVSNDPSSPHPLSVVAIVGTLTGLPDNDGASTPKPIALSAWPNPFNPQATFGFTLARAAAVDLAIYDVAGRLQRRLIAGGTMPAGRHEAIWDGRDESGVRLPSGVYLARLDTGRNSSVERVVLLK